MAAIKEIKAYKTSDGVIFEDKDEAIRYDKERDFRNVVRDFADAYGNYSDEKERIYEVITENVDELKSIFSLLN